MAIVGSTRLAVGDPPADSVSSSLAAGNLLFRKDLDIDDLFIDHFASLNPALVRFRDDRFAHYLRQSELLASDHKSTPTIDLPQNHEAP
eukprot:6188634-Pleurochrysis_carterae.AAC.1